ncbi:MAG: AAA family ATPase [Alphaproteobacteria bacterium]
MRASDGHHHLSGSNIVSFEKLATLFDGKTDGAAQKGDIVGDFYQNLLAEMAAITEHQWRSASPRGLAKGFMLSGPPGTGKTTMAKRLAYELGKRFQADDQPPVVMAFVDGGEISRSRYGESEERIRDIFMHAKAGFTAQGQRSVLLFDDVESIFMSRGSQHAKEWHFSQDSVFFHSIDELDTTRSIIVLTSNRPDLIDEAIRDRFLSYAVPYPDLDTLIRMTAQIPALQDLTGAEQAAMRDALSQAVKAGEVRSMREAQRFALRRFVAKLLKRESMALQHAD